METTIKTTNTSSKKFNPPPVKILIVDDDTALLKATSEILTKEGYITKEAQTGKEAIEKCQKEFFDFGLIDLKLPDIEGTKLLEILKNINPKMIKIIITGYPSLESAVNSLNFGAEEYLIKPFNPAELIDLIKDQSEKTRVDKWEKLFVGVGLSANEAKVYLALAMNGTLEIRKVSMASGVPRTKTYAAVKKLIQRGLVSEFPGPMQKLSITSPASAFDPILKNWKRDLSDQSKTLAEFEKALKLLESINTEKISSPQTGIEKETIWTMTGTQEINQRISEMLQEATSSVRILANEDGLVRFYKNFGKKLDQLCLKKVKVQFNIPTDSVNKTLLNDLKYAYKVVNVQEADTPYFLLNVDQKKVLIADLKGNSSDSPDEKEMGILAKSEKLAIFFRRFFNLEEEKSVVRHYGKSSASMLRNNSYYHTRPQKRMQVKRSYGVRSCDTRR